MIDLLLEVLGTFCLAALSQKKGDSFWLNYILATIFLSVLPVFFK